MNSKRSKFLLISLNIMSTISFAMDVNAPGNVRKASEPVGHAQLDPSSLALGIGKSIIRIQNESNTILNVRVRGGGHCGWSCVMRWTGLRNQPEPRAIRLT